MKERYPIRALNVELEDIRTGFRLKGVLIRPTVSTRAFKDSRVSWFNNDSYYVVTCGTDGENQRMGGIIGDETLTKIQAGEEVKLRSHLTKIDLKWEIFRAIKLVSSSQQ